MSFAAAWEWAKLIGCLAALTLLVTPVIQLWAQSGEPQEPLKKRRWRRGQ